MAFTGNHLCTSFKQEALSGTHLTTDVYKIALYTSAATLDKTTTAYSATNESSGTGYSAGGATLGGVSVGTLGTWAYLTFNDPSWSTATITARGALIYNSSKSNKAVNVMDFGSDKSSSAGTFLVDLGNASTSSASITFAATTLTRAAGDFVADGYQVGHVIITDDATNPGPYTITTVATTVLTCSAANMTVGGPRTVSLRAVVVAW